MLKYCDVSTHAAAASPGLWRGRVSGQRSPGVRGSGPFARGGASMQRGGRGSLWLGLFASPKILISQALLCYSLQRNTGLCPFL